MVRTRGLSHVELVVGDVDRSIQFYGNVFGFEVVHRRNGRALLLVPGAPGSLGLKQALSVLCSRVHFGLALVDPVDVDSAVKLVEANGGVLVRRTALPIGGATAVVADPTGHRITL